MRLSNPSDTNADKILTFGWKAAASVSSVRAVSLAAILLATTLLRHHLFIWSVFAPKFIFALVHAMVDAIAQAMIALSIYGVLVIAL